jgi:hypothetical protein
MKITIELDDTGRTAPSVRVFQDGKQVGLIRDLDLHLSANGVLPDLKVVIPEDNERFSDEIRQSLRRADSMGGMAGVTVERYSVEA